MTNKIFEVADSIKYDTNDNLQSFVSSTQTDEIKRLLSPYKKGSLGIAQINTIAGDIKYNAKKTLAYISLAEKMGIELIIFPDLTLIGYPMADVIKRHKIIANDNLNWLIELAKITTHTTAFVGFVEPVRDGKSTTYYNSTAILANGEIKGFVRKFEISNCSCEKSFSTNLYQILAPERIGKPVAETADANKSNIYIINGIKYGFSDNLNNSNVSEKPDVIITSSLYINNLYEESMREYAIEHLSKQSNSSIVVVNQVGSTDNVSYIGGSYIYNKGQLISKAKTFEEQFLIANPIMNLGKIYPSTTYNKIKNTKFTLDYESDLERTYKTIIQGVRDYFTKNGIKRACLGLSGGLDSSVCAVIIADAIGKENVFGISMPSKITSKESRTDAEQLALNLGINYTEIPIKEVFDTTESVFNNMFEQVEKSWNCRYKKSFTNDNIQARARATYLWGIANEFESCIPIATSDKSEAYMGYATINGDMSGGFAPIADVTKTKLFALAKWLNKNREIKNAIPESIILKRPGAELAIDERTGKPLIAEDALMPYEFLDEIIWRIENNNECYRDMVNSEFLYEKSNLISKEQKIEWLDKFYKRMSSALYKWSILPPSVSIDSESINKCVYNQPVTTSHINYKGATKEEIISELNISSGD